STGIFTNGKMLCRCLRNRGTDGAGELLIYDERGVRRYLRIDELAGTHDIVWDGDNFVAVSSGTNSILWISAAGDVVRRWRAPGEDDSWHLNSLLLHRGKLLISAFGRYQNTRQWSEHLVAGHGVVFDQETGQDLISGLCAPHHPRWVDGAWLVCNSGMNSVMQLRPDGTVLKTVSLRSWPRGLAICDDYVLVGESVTRHAHLPAAVGPRNASIAVLSRHTLELVERFSVPCSEVYDLVVIPPTLLSAVRKGFRTNNLRVSEQDQHWLFQRAGVSPVRLWAVCDPLPPEQCRISVHAEVPEVLPAGATVAVECTVTNVGGVLLASAPPYPVNLSYRWLPAEDIQGWQHEEGLRTRLPRSLPPREALNCRISIRAPKVPGRFTLHITAVQEAVAWFDDLSLENCCTATIRID
ncbi:MAG TPA: DUF4915 domain-containing protein, partial [Bryobacteraceae bacterium]|nr:DUF4915 domain-containing protein [Bryobacteraceae bacterium]